MEDGLRFFYRKIVFVFLIFNRNNLLGLKFRIYIFNVF